MEKKRRKNKVVASQKQTVAKALARQVEQYDVASGLAQRNAGLNIGQLFRGHVKDASTTAQKLFGRQAEKRVAAAASSPNFAEGNLIREEISRAPSSEKILKLVTRKYMEQR